MKIPFECPDPKCGKVDHLLFDASGVKEREFEGIFFRVDLVKGKPVISGQENDKEYLEDFNMKKILKEAKELIAESDTLLFCPKCMEPLE